MSDPVRKKQKAAETSVGPAMSDSTAMPTAPEEATTLYKKYVHDVQVRKKQADSATRRKMTVKEMAELLGLRKTESYWLVHKNVFETSEIAGKMWVDVPSFEKWYANQIKYRKVTGEEPGKELKEWSYSVRDLSELLGISESAVYEMIKTKQIETVTVDYWMRIPKDSFRTWYESQDHYRTADDRKKEKTLRDSSISLPQMAHLLGISRARVYQILKSRKYAGFLEVIELAGGPRVTKKSFSTFLSAQDDYKLVSSLQNSSLQHKKPLEKTRPDKDSHDNSSGSDPCEAGGKDLSPTPETTPASGTQGPEYLTLTEAAAIADISRQAVMKLASYGYFGCQKYGRLIRINKKELEEWLLTR